MKKYIYLLFLLLILPFNTNALIERSSDIYVTDEGKILKEETKETILSYSNFLDIEKDVQYYVVTVKDLENMTLENYAQEIFEAFELDDRSLLILISKDDRRFRIEVGDDISNILTSKQVDKYINEYFMPFFQNSDWDKGIRNGYLAIYKDLAEYYNIDVSDISIESGNDILVKYRVPIVCIVIFINTMIVQAICISIKKLLSKYDHIDTLDKFIMPLLLIINILLLIIAYMIMPLSLILVLGIEVYAIYANLSLDEKKTESLKLKKQFKKEMEKKQKSIPKQKEVKKNIKKNKKIKK